LIYFALAATGLKGGSRLLIRMVWGPTTGEQAALVLSETPGKGNGSSNGLTAREREVLAHASKGQTAAEIADALCISRRTVEKHLEHIYDKLDVESRVAAVTRVFLS